MGNSLQIVRDAANQRFYIVQVEDDGTWDLSKGLINLDLRDTNPDSTTGRQLAIDWLDFYAAGTSYGNDADGNAMIPGQRYQALVLMSAPKKLTGSVGTGSGAQRFRVKSVQGDYVTCRTYGDRVIASAAVHAAGTGYAVGNVLTPVGGTGTVGKLTVASITGGGGTGPIGSVNVTNGGAYATDPTTSANAATGGSGTGATFDLTMGGGEGGTDVLVAKPPELRHSVNGQTIDGVAWTFTYNTKLNNLDGYRKASSAGKADEYFEVVPVYMTDGSSLSEIWGDQPVGGTGVVVAGVPLTWMDTNRNQRFWQQYQ